MYSFFLIFFTKNYSRNKLEVNKRRIGGNKFFILLKRKYSLVRENYCEAINFFFNVMLFIKR